MRHRICVPALVAALLGAAVGCASDIQSGTAYDPLASFPASATFVWDERASSLPDDERIRQLDLGAMIRELADEEFAARGYRESTSGAANYRLSYELTTNTWIGPSSSHAIGSLSLQLAEAGSGRRAWVGFARAEVHVALTPEQRRERLRKVMRELLKDFPPSQPGR